MTLGLSISPVPLAAHSIGARQRGWGLSLGDHICPESPLCLCTTPAARRQLGKDIHSHPVTLCSGSPCWPGMSNFRRSWPKTSPRRCPHPEPQLRTLSPNPRQSSAGLCRAPGLTQVFTLLWFPHASPQEVPILPSPPPVPLPPPATPQLQPAQQKR